VDRLTQAKLALVVMAAIFFAGALRLGVAWPNWAAIGLLVLALLLRAVAARRQGSRDDAQPPDEAA
jgi:hypothetical protein